MIEKTGSEAKSIVNEADQQLSGDVRQAREKIATESDSLAREGPPRGSSGGRCDAQAAAPLHPIDHHHPRSSRSMPKTPNAVAHGSEKVAHESRPSERSA